MPEFRNFDEARRILDRRTVSNSTIQSWRTHLEHANGSGKAPELLSSTNLNIPGKSHDQIRMALLDLGNREIKNWTPEDRATFEKIQNFMRGKFQFRAYDTCLLREIESRFEARSPTRSDIPRDPSRTQTAQ